MKVFNVLFLMSFIISCAAQETHKIDFLEGTWKMENKETYEEWKKEGEVLIGHAYKLLEGQKQISETLKIKTENEDLIYEATVPNQNDGRTIPFRLNRAVQDQLSFENLTHDFPKKIQYKLINETRIQVMVLGEDDQGFGYFLIKQT